MRLSRFNGMSRNPMNMASSISSLEQTSHGIQTSLHIQTSPGVRRRSHEMLVLVEAAKMLLSFHRPSSTSSPGRHPVVTRSSPVAYETYSVTSGRNDPGRTMVVVVTWMNQRSPKRMNSTIVLIVHRWCGELTLLP